LRSSAIEGLWAATWLPAIRKSEVEAVKREPIKARVLDMM
jgi:hypothetical protein